MNTKNITLTLFLLTTISLAIFSCKKKKTNEAMYEEASSGSLSFYKGKDTLWDPKGGSPHGFFKLKFNQTALNALGADGKLPLGQTFPDGSLIVKEIYTNNALSLYAVMRKDPKSKFASNKWVWAEYEPNGKVVIGVNKEGKDCVSCHTGGNPRDLTLSFDLH
ncbi:MAG: cytochrome P460 family protein [Bacteroidota bacterium]|mgnify:CR=1 FL=1|nr:cytochrome P460 family protein [Bacteroidota bacterium]